MSSSSLRVGCDLCQVVLMEQMIKEGDGALERLFHLEERQYAMSQGNPAQRLAGIFAAKEALAKAVRQPGLLGKYHQEVRVEHEQDGSPFLRLSTGLAQTFTQQGIQVADLSISHDGDYAMAAVLIEWGVPNRLKCTKCLLTLDHLSEQSIADFLIRVEGRDGTRYLCPSCMRGW